VQEAQIVSHQVDKRLEALEAGLQELAESSQATSANASTLAGLGLGGAGLAAGPSGIAALAAAAQGQVGGGVLRVCACVAAGRGGGHMLG
jgi:hypothetical protein